MKKIFPLFFIFLFLSCKKKECRVSFNYYNFETRVELSPTIDTFPIGDTIHIKSEFSDLIYERQSEQSFLLEDFTFEPAILIRKIDSIPVIESAIYDFEYLFSPEINLEFFDASTGESALFMDNYKYDSNIYHLSFNMIPKRKGLYYFSFFNGSELVTENQHFNGKCPDIKSEFFTIMNEGADNNVDFLLDCPDENYSVILWDKRATKFFRSGGYCFYVVD